MPMKHPWATHDIDKYNKDKIKTITPVLPLVILKYGITRLDSYLRLRMWRYCKNDLNAITDAMNWFEFSDTYGRWKDTERRRRLAIVIFSIQTGVKIRSIRYSFPSFFKYFLWLVIGLSAFQNFYYAPSSNTWRIVRQTYVALSGLHNDGLIGFIGVTVLGHLRRCLANQLRSSITHVRSPPHFLFFIALFLWLF